MTTINKILFHSFIYIALLSMSLLTSCSNGISSPNELMHWVNNPDQGLIKTKLINGFKLTVKYLPPQYLAWQDIKGEQYAKNTYDSILNGYTKFRTFLLTIAPDEEHSQADIMFYDVINKVDYKKRVQDLNFNIASYISLHTKSGELFPVLHTLENTYELAKHKSIYLVFADNENIKDLLTSEKLDFKFSDTLFDTGISHFVFHKADFDTVAKMKFELNKI
ncbi:MAG: hypothetical protein L3J29_13200 [Cyclobacteriaceae bacterium]|nr:hypothetical protein [Cyclobacteriaceae bacterium]